MVKAKKEGGRGALGSALRSPVSDVAVWKGRSVSAALPVAPASLYSFRHHLGQEIQERRAGKNGLWPILKKFCGQAGLRIRAQPLPIDCTRKEYGRMTLAVTEQHPERVASVRIVHQ